MHDDTVKQQQDEMKLQEGEDQPTAGCLPSPCRFRCSLSHLQGPVRHHRDAARAVLRLIKEPVCRRDPTICSRCRLLTFRPDQMPRFGHYLRRNLADHHGPHDVVPDEVNPTPRIRPRR